ncbi:hypothetical protein HMH01_04205 [Halovulum dunhuangense]|uniref:AB hydrolase-1 domain-containing protein n=1 Tax=Halovulum dunhuangense TaxID=1505036 RepID=A0A849KY23_9RHOB|nr:alpha/beta fold hydrolase [Halovulum dunhuangense]NNU79637.1 hypothetical protein [Halovulum dunhuangense]
MKDIAPHRIGQPSPIAVHLGAAASGYLQAILAAPNAAEPDFPWHPTLPRYAGPAPEPLDVTAEAARRMARMLRGIEAWQRHPYRRGEIPRPVLWADGATRLVDHGAGASGPVVVVVPSLINRPYVLDLLPERSFLGALRAAGLRPLLLDWGAPGAAEAGFDIDCYRHRRLAPALEAARRLTGRTPALLGYCMGGTISAGHVIEGAEVSALVTIGAPWDFDAARGFTQGIRAAVRQAGDDFWRRTLRSLVEAFGLVPVTLFQHLFALVDPIQATRKFQAFAALDPDSDRARLFVALEDWLADGIPMAGPAAETLLIDWHLDNATGTGRWPERISTDQQPPALIVSGLRDGIAPPGVSAALSRAFPEATVLSPALGHVGMITGAAAPARVWRPVVEFLRANA